MPSRFLLIGWDAADWSVLHPLIDAGRMPALRALVENGTSGALRPVSPTVHSALWTSLFTGRHAFSHGVFHDLEMCGRRSVPVSSASRTRRAVWDVLAENGVASVAVGWPATHGAAAGDAWIVSDRYPEPTAGPEAETWPPAITGAYSNLEIGKELDELRVRPEEIDAAAISFFVPQWRRIDPRRDSRLARLRLALAADASIQAACTALMERCDRQFHAVRFPGLGNLSAMFLPMHRPGGGWVSDDERSAYGGVISAACRVFDLMLRRLLDLAGPETNVLLVSPCGIPAPPVRPDFPMIDEPARAPGILVAHGPAFRRDELIHGACVLDVAPTILASFGFRDGRQMDGRILAPAFADAPDMANAADPRRMEPVGQVAEIPDPASPLGFQAAWNCARSFLHAGRNGKALEILEELFENLPERPDVSAALFECQLREGRLTDAEQTLEVLLEALPPSPIARVFRAEFALARGEKDAARRLVKEALKTRSHPIETLTRIGLLLIRLRDWKHLKEVARRALEMNPDEPLAWLALAEAHLRENQFEHAAVAAREAVRRRYSLAESHLALGRALAAQRMWFAARSALQTAIRLQPENPLARAYLRRLARIFPAGEEIGAPAGA